MAVSKKAITYTDEFKRHLIAENEKGELTTRNFEEAGVDVEEEVKIATELKFILVQHTIKKDKLKRMVSYLYDVIEVSRQVTTITSRKNQYQLRFAFGT